VNEENAVIDVDALLEEMKRIQEYATDLERNAKALASTFESLIEQLEELP
jgi:tetrahydromethanopterin S-methyltransferase subunit B